MAGFAAAHHVEAGIGKAAQQQGVAYEAYRRGIDDYIVIMLAQLGNQVGHALAHEQFAGVGGHGPAYGIVEAGVELAGVNELLPRSAGAYQPAGDGAAGGIGGVLHVAGQFGLAHVELQHHHFFAAEGQRDAKVEGDKAFAFATVGAGDEQYPVVLPFAHKLQVGPQQAEHFGRGSPFFFRHHNGVAQGLPIKGDSANDGGMGVLADLVFAVHFGVEGLADGDDRYRHDEAKYEAQGPDDLGFGFDLDAGVGWFYHPAVAHRHRQT